MTDIANRVPDHPVLLVRGFVTEFSPSLGERPTPDSVLELLQLEADTPISRDDDHRKAIRDVLRHGGYKPTGRGKPASEYLVRAAGEGKLGSINLAVDVCNAVSLASGIPTSVVDLERTSGELSIAHGLEGTSYVFNASGQEIDIRGLLCLFDEEGPCANGVKDSQRTKTSEATVRTLSVLWGHRDFADRADLAVDWSSRLLSSAGAVVTPACFK